jgi:hypothetical protein
LREKSSIGFVFFREVVLGVQNFLFLLYPFQNEGNMYHKSSNYWNKPIRIDFAGTAFTKTSRG